MNPNFLHGMAAFALISGRLRLSQAPTEEQLAQMKQARIDAIAAKRADSPHVAAAEAKRQRKRDKLRALEGRQP